MKSAISQRIKTFCEYKNLSILQFEKSCMLSNGYVRGISKAIGNEKLKTISLNYPELNIKWLLTGEGQMLNDSDISSVIDQEVKPYTTNSQGVKFFEREDGQLLMEVPVVPFDALGSVADETQELTPARDEWETMRFEVDAVHHGRYYAFVVDNDSMDDGSRQSFAKGDVVLVRELPRQDWAPLLRTTKWRFWVVCFGNCIRIKQIIDQDAEAGTITLHSLNPSPEYADFTLSLDDIRSLFYVVQLHPHATIF